MKYFSIPEPCTENWNEMSATERGAFCQKCATEVHDVSNMSNPEIIQLISSEEKTPCMRMTPSQERSLNIDFRLMHQSQKRTMQRAMLFSLLVVFGFTLFSCDNSQQIHERNLLESVAESIVASAEETKTEAEETLRLSSLSGDAGESFTVKDIDQVEPLEIIEEELYLLGEPAMPDEKLIEEVIIQRTKEYHESYQTMGIPAMRYDVHDLDIHEVIDETTTAVNKESNLPETFSALTFPNPASIFTTLKVELPNSTENLGIRLLDMNGRILQDINDKAAEAGKHEFRIDLMDLKPAYYLIDVRYNDQHEVVRLSKVQ